MRTDARAAAAPSRVAALAAPAAAAGAAAGVLVVVGLVDPNTAGHYPTCPFLFLTGLQCPGCGTLRALHALTRGDVAAAVGLNALAMAAVPLLVWIWFGWLRRRLAGRPRSALAHPAWLWALAGAVVIFWVVRNTPAGASLAP